MTAGVPAQRIPLSLAAREGRWRDYLAGRKILLVLDDAAGHEQVQPLLPGTGDSMVLVTSRRRLAALADVRVISIDAMSPPEAATLLVKLAGRADLDADSEAIGQIASLCGYLPLAIGMLAAQLRHHPAWTGAALAAELAATNDRLVLMHAEDLSVAAAFDLSHADLNPDQQRLFRRLGMAPGRDVDGYAAAALDETSPGAGRRLLDELYDHHLITEPAPGRYLLHDLLREHARALAVAAEADSRAAAGRLVNYYAHTAAAASTHIATWTTAGGRRPASEPPAAEPPLRTSEQASSWLEAERPNLHAAADYAAAHGMYPHAVAIVTAMGGFLRARGHWDQAASLYRTALAAARAAGDKAGQAGALDELGLLQQLDGDYQAATRTLTEAAGLFRGLGDLSGEAYALNHLGLVQHETGQFQEAAANHLHALALAGEAGDPLAEAVSRTDFGMGQQLTGDYAGAIASYEQAIPLFRDVDSQFDLADALSELGNARRLAGDYAGAIRDQQQSLELFRRLGDRLGQAWALDGLGLASQMTGDYAAAAGRMAEALTIYRELGYRFGEAMALNSLGDLSARTGDAAAARGRYREALAVASDLGAPPQEARALEGLGRTFLPDSPAEAAEHLRAALTVYQRLGLPDAKATRDLLDQYGL
jgi:tetratricopeptide (TPR) repeat protein